MIWLLKGKGAIAMTIAVEHMRECSLVLMKGSIKAADCALLENVLETASISINKNIWIDCEHITSISTGALRMLLSLSSKAKPEGIKLLFYQMNPSLRKTMRESMLDSVLHIVPSITDAHRFCKHNREI